MPVIKPWTFPSAFRDAFYSDKGVMEVYWIIDKLEKEQKAEAELMLRELGYDF
jgi:hypothetical protein